MQSPVSLARVGVGVGVLVFRDDRVLLGKRVGSHGAGTWSAPGGRLEYGESILECARRELYEETGLQLGSVEHGPYTNDVFHEVLEQYVTVFVIARDVTGTVENREPHKCESWHWFSWQELPEPLFKPLYTLVQGGFLP